jgi:hypothetical protein
MTVELRRPRYLPELPETLSVNLVRVREVDTPADCDPVDWILVTNEPIKSREQVLGDEPLRPKAKADPGPRRARTV